MKTGDAKTGSKVLEFYKELPFNYRETIKEHVKAIKRQNSVNAYPELQKLLEKKKTTILEVGCGVGWLSNALAYYHKCLVTGLDFNPVAIDRAKEISHSLKTDVDFHVGNLFEFNHEAPVDLVVSLGVLHHTGDCTGAVRRVCQEFVKPGGHVFIGLYHSYGREPFLNHFKQMQESGASEDDMLNRFRDLDPRFKDDETHLRSWFRDQVLHPHETQHTLEEICPILDDCGMALVSTSINRFQEIVSRESLWEQEKTYRALGEERLAAGQYFSGFFIFLARKN